MVAAEVEALPPPRNQLLLLRQQPPRQRLPPQEVELVVVQVQPPGILVLLYVYANSAFLSFLGLRTWFSTTAARRLHTTVIYGPRNGGPRQVRDFFLLILYRLQLTYHTDTPGGGADVWTDNGACASAKEAFATDAPTLTDSRHVVDKQSSVNVVTASASDAQVTSTTQKRTSGMKKIRNSAGF